MGQQDFARFEIVGTVSQINVARSGKATFIKVRVKAEREAFIELTAFHSVSGPDKGDLVKATGNIRMKKLDGFMQQRGGKSYDVWVPSLICDRIEVLEEGQKNIPGTTGTSSELDGGDIPF